MHVRIAVAAREPIAAKLLASLTTAAGADGYWPSTCAPQLQGFFDMPVASAQGPPILSQHLKQRGLTGCVIVSPDVGGVARARVLAEHLDATLAIVDKRRPKPNVSEVMNIIGDVQGKPCVLVDDLVDTAGTIVQAAQGLIDRGATSVRACCTHGVLTGPAIDRLKASPIEELVITNTIPVTAHDTIDKITVLSVAPLFAEAIRRIYEELSVSILFD